VCGTSFLIAVKIQEKIGSLEKTGSEEWRKIQKGRLRTLYLIAYY
jgi:hypothetical protein